MKFARTRRARLQTKGAVGIDVTLGAFPFEDEAIRRSKEIAFVPGRALQLGTAGALRDGSRRL